MTLEEKKVFIRQLYKMSKADNKIVPVEKNFLYEIALSINFPIEDLEDILDEKEFSVKEKTVTNIEERIVQLYRLVLMMKIDNEISVEEINTLKSIALEMGIRPDSVMLLLDRLSESVTKTLEYKELQAIFNIVNN